MVMNFAPGVEMMLFSSNFKVSKSAVHAPQLLG